MAEMPDPQPTAWFVSQSNNVRQGAITAAARWYWPGSTRTDFIHPGTSWQWVPMDGFIDIYERQAPWKISTQEDVEDWISSQNPASAPED
jgi:hypothetical protein